MSPAKEAPTYRFGDFRLDVANRQLWQGEARVDLSGRYFDALALLVREHGQLVAKDRFFDEVWGDVVVSDAALTQCIKSVRRHLGDDAAAPRYIQTVPRYGYRFICTVSAASPSAPVAPFFDGVPDVLPQPASDVTARVAEMPEGPGALHRAFVTGLAGTLGGGLAGVPGGVLYGLGLAATPAGPSLGTASLVLVLVGLCVLVGAIGGAGVSIGMAAAGLARRTRPAWSIAGAAAGGMLVGGLAKLLGVDAFALLFGRTPAGITGGLEGAALGAAVALGAYLGGGLDAKRSWRPVVGAGLLGAVAGLLIPLAGGRLMGGSLERLARSFASSRLQLDSLGRFFGDVHFGGTTQVLLGGIEGLLFGSFVAGTIVLARRAWPVGT